MRRQPEAIDRRCGSYRCGSLAACLRGPLICLAITSSLLAFEDNAPKRPPVDAPGLGVDPPTWPPAVAPPDFTARTEQDQVRSDLKHLIGRWMRTLPGEQDLREVLTIDGEHDTLDVLNRDGAVICRTTSRFGLERVGDVRIYNRTDVNVTKGHSRFRPETESQSFIVQLTRHGFYEVSGLLYDRNASQPVQSAILWTEIGAPKSVPVDDADLREKLVKAQEELNELKALAELTIVPAEPADAKPTDGKQSNFEPPPGMADDPDLKRDLELLQGEWFLKSRNADGRVAGSIKKLIEGNTERVIFSNAEGKVAREHTVKFRLEKYGPARIFYFYDMTTVAGAGAGTFEPEGRAFVYKVDSDTFLDCGGTFASRESYRNEPAVVVWRRPPTVEEMNAELAIEERGGVIFRETRAEGETTIVRLIANEFGDEHLAMLKSFKNLTELELVGANVTDAGMQEVALITSLRSLYVFGTPITDAGLKEIARLEKLTSLGLERTHITDAGLAELSRLKELRQLYLDRMNITDKGARHLARLSELTTLSVVETKITEAGLAELSSLGSLSTLKVGGQRITDGSVEQLVKFKNLSELRIINSQLTEAGFQKIKAALPETNVHR